jgi:type II secretory pathway component PulF
MVVRPILIMGLIVGFIVVALLMAIFSLTEVAL